MVFLAAFTFGLESTLCSELHPFYPSNLVSKEVFFLAFAIRPPLQQSSGMAIKMKGLLKGIKYISQIFVHKEHELDIGPPTNVKHVAHVGFGSQFGASPSWMNDYKTSPDFSSGSLSAFGSRETSWASQDFEQRDQIQAAAVILAEHPCPDIPRAPKKNRPRNKSKVTSPAPRSSASSASLDSYSTALEDVADHIPTAHFRLL